jgi:acetyl-CoA C-acetyltransferase
MRPVYIVGAGQTPIREHWGTPLRQLAADAVVAALAEAELARPDALYVGNMLSGALNAQENLAALIADWSGLRGIEAVKVEAACGSGAAALRVAILAVASGLVDTAVAAGVEKMTDTAGHDTTSALATAADADYEANQGLSFIAINALLMQRYMHAYGWQHADFAGFSLNAHANAARNPNALLREPVTAGQYAKARMLSAPINLLDAAPIGDGAAAVVVAAAPRAAPAARILGSAVASDSVSLHERRDPLQLHAAAASAALAYRQAGIGPDEVDIFELHDAFSIMSALSLEAAGFAAPGQGVRLALEGAIGPGGRLPIGTFGGLKARGHPVGATGMYQVVELTLQLTGRAGGCQVERARVGLAQNIGGSGATVVTHVLAAA